MDKIKYLLFLALCACLTTSYAQKRISGNVWSKVDGPIMMANVVERDANNRIVEATTTDMNGNFSMTIRNPKNTLEISYVGYQTTKISPIDKTTYKIEMREKNQIKEVVVKGVKKQNSGGLVIPEREVSVAQQTLNMDDMEGLSFETADQALQGQIAGLDIVVNSGNLGSGTTMRLRGVTSINGNQEPLIVVDGNILDDYNSDELDFESLDNTEQFAQLLSVNPDDIQNIKVLKDAAATAIWGSRGANGVLEITTRRGKRGKTRVEFNYRFKGSWQPDGMKMLSGDEYTMMLKEAYFNPKQNSVTSDIVELSYDRNRTAYFANYNKNTDWFDEVTQFAQTHNYSLNLTGGGEKATFRVSGSYDHETGTIIKQELDRFSTRMVLDYYVSDRIKFSSNVALTYTNNLKNYSDILAAAYNAMPNMSLTRWEYDMARDDFYDTGEYYLMPRRYGAAGPVPDGYTSYYLNDMIGNGNPVATANLAWIKEQTYKISPQFQIEYKLLGKSDDETQLKYTGEVYLNAFSISNSSFFPAQLSSNTWSDGLNKTSSSESKSMSFTTRHSLNFNPHFSNTDHALGMMVRMEMSTSSSNSQNISSSGVAGGITDPTVGAYLTGASTGTGESHWVGFVGTAHYSYKSKYSITGTLRVDGSTKFGADNRWGYFPGISGRWNISDEGFMKPLTDRRIITMLAFKPGWGLVGNAPSSEGLMYNKYRAAGTYGANGYYMNAMIPVNLRMTTLKWEKTKSWNLGFELAVLDDLLNFDLNIYNKKTSDLLMQGMRIPSSTGFATLDYANVGDMKNEGWELYVSTKELFKVGDFSVKFKVNFSQNINRVTYMDESVLASKNADYDYKNESIMQRVQIGNALGGIYGFRFKGVYQYDYDHCGYFSNSDQNDPDNKIYAGNTAWYAENVLGKKNVTTPVARDANGEIIYDANGDPLRMYFDYGGKNYQFKGGDVIYEDINHDGQINELDIVYLGSSNPTINGGFGVDFKYGRWTLKSNFSFRVGNKIINMARMKAEDMRTNKNQSKAVNWRWRKNGDITEIPRAMNSEIGESYNALISDRYVEKGDYLRLNYLQLGYSFNPSALKKYGLSSLRLSASADNLFCFTKYTGADPDHAQSGFGPAVDNSKTPRGRSFTLSLTVGF